MYHKIMFLLVSLALALCFSGCGHKKIVAKNCDQASNSGIWVCDPL